MRDLCRTRLHGLHLRHRHAVRSPASHMGWASQDQKSRGCLYDIYSRGGSPACTGDRRRAGPVVTSGMTLHRPRRAIEPSTLTAQMAVLVHAMNEAPHSSGPWCNVMPPWRLCGPPGAGASPPH